MVTATERPDDLRVNDEPYSGGLAMVAPAIGPGWVGDVLGGWPLLVTMAAVGAVLGLACGRHLARLLQAEAVLVALVVAALMLV
jgi:hypothetical protein